MENNVILSKIGSKNTVYIQCACLAACSILTITKYTKFEKETYHFSLLNHGASNIDLGDCKANTEDIDKFINILSVMKNAKDNYSMTLCIESGDFIEITKIGTDKEMGILSIDFYRSERKYAKEKCLGGIIIEINNIVKIINMLKRLKVNSPSI